MKSIRAGLILLFIQLVLVLSVAGVALAMLGAGRLYAPGLVGRRALLLPAGALVYIAVPPARDFATSGLENGLVLAYLGLLWWPKVVRPTSCQLQRKVLRLRAWQMAGSVPLPRTCAARAGAR